MKTFKKPLTSAEEREYLKLLKEGDQTARDILIEHNMRLVAHIIKKYAFTDKEMDDLLSIGTIGLIKAVNTFNPDRGNKLSSYAAKCIDNEILMLLRSEKKRSREVSLYEPIGTDKEGNEINLMDVIEMDEREISELVAMKEDLKKLYEAYETCLSDKEKKVIRFRYGLFGSDEYTQREIAKALGISRSYVSRIEKGALAKMKRYMQ
ncbi:MAG: RNA polymerase sporulation sigma factor SigK [Lachnospiraceae bacterium]|nr:RNA polymerase sporulation sigma factor SigK [Candidatus Fimimorpha excrementavium]